MDRCSPALFLSDKHYVVFKYTALRGRAQLKALTFPNPVVFAAKLAPEE
jgi:hypothetical protein